MHRNNPEPPSFEDFLRSLGLELELPKDAENMEQREPMEAKSDTLRQAKEEAPSSTKRNGASDEVYASDRAWQEKNEEWNREENAWDREETNWEENREKKSQEVLLKELREKRDRQPKEVVDEQARVQRFATSPTARMREARKGIIWSEILQPPLAKRRR